MDVRSGKRGLREPSPATESTPTEPPSCSAIDLQIDSPSPVPWVKVSSLTKRSKMRSRSSGAMPMPVSRT